MMTRLVSWLFFISLGIIAMLFVLPGMINWERHKDLLVTDAGSAIGQKISVEGAVSLRLLPNPQILLEKVTVGEGDQYLLRLKRMEARLKLQSLLEGRYEIDSLSLIEPEINIVIAANGASNWNLPNEQKPAGKASMIALKQVGVTHARLKYSNLESGHEVGVDKVNMTMEAASLFGPYKLRGDFLYGEAPTNFTLNTGAYKADQNFDFEFALQPIENLPQTVVKATYAPDGATKLVITAREGKLASLLSPLFADWQDVFAASPVFADNSEVEAVIERNTNKIWAVPSFSLKQGKGSVKGGIIFDNGVVVTLDAANINLGKPVLPPVPVGFSIKGNGIAFAGRGFDKAEVEGAFERPVQNQPQWRLTKAVLNEKGNIYAISGALDAAASNGEGAINAKIADLSKLQTGLPALAADIQARWVRSAGTASFTDVKVSLPQAVMFGEAGLALAGTLQTTPQGLSYNLSAANGLQIKGVAAKDLPFTADVAYAALGAAVKGKITEQNGLGLSGDADNIDATKLLSFYGQGMEGVTFGPASARLEGVFDINAKSFAEAVTGKIILTPASMRINAFDPAALQKFVLAQTSVPQDLGKKLLAELRSGEAALAKTPLVINLSPAAQLAALEKLPYEGGEFSLKRSAKGVVAVDVTPSDGPAYGGALPLAELPVNEFAAFIRQRHPGPTIETKEAVGSILKSLEEEEQVLPAPPPVQDTSLPAPEETMPPQPLPALPEVEVGLPPSLPPETEETAPPADDMMMDEVAVEEIFPIEEPLPVPPPDIPPPDIPPP